MEGTMHKKSIVTFLSILLTFVTCFELFAQDDSTWFYDKPISKITFEGLVHVNRDEVTSVTNQYLGKDFTDTLYSELISKIYALELFEDIIPEAIPANADENAYVADYDRDTPVIIVHGMSQNDTYLLNEDGTRMTDENGDYIYTFNQNNEENKKEDLAILLLCLALN